jgi:intraflagellar transport protein 172
MFPSYFNRYDEVIRLVETHHPEHISETLKHLAEIYATEDNYKAAEIQYLKANYWEEAVNMYQSKGLWEDAYRVARTHGGVETSRHVIYRWASTLPPDSAVKLLNKYGYINDCIDYNCHKGNVRSWNSFYLVLK